MGKFIIATFLMLGFAFYELSGGDEFEPRGVRPAKTVEVDKNEPQIVADVPVSEPKIKTVIAPRKTTTSVSADATTQAPTEAALVLAQARANLSQGLTLLSDQNPTQGLQLASLSDGLSGLQNAAVEPEETVIEYSEQPAVFDQDIREIKGTRVNMRQGPGTNYPVVTRLTLGHEVEVLSESGTGWLRLRSMPEGTMGWISASLVTKKAP